MQSPFLFQHQSKDETFTPKGRRRPPLTLKVTNFSHGHILFYPLHFRWWRDEGESIILMEPPTFSSSFSFCCSKQRENSIEGALNYKQPAKRMVQYNRVLMHADEVTDVYDVVRSLSRPSLARAKTEYQITNNTSFNVIIYRSSDMARQLKAKRG